LQNNFNHITPIYDFLAGLIFGKSIKESQIWLLPFIPENANMLIIGGGTGWILEEILATNFKCRIVYLEASKKMLKQSQKRYQKHAKKSNILIEFRLGTEIDLKETESFDVIFTGFLLDLFLEENLRKLMQKLYKHLKPGELWLIADFQPKNATRFWQKSLLQTMISFFKITANLQANQLPDLDSAFSGFQLKPEHQKLFYHKLIQSSVYRKQV